VVGTVSGFRIRPGQGTSSPSNTRQPNVAAYVLDRAYAHRIVASFERRRRTRWPDGLEAAAHAYAAELNKRDAA
jgi:hypothetical protein